jgi:NAD(P)-dependent dehydrogenase (short-subunit alcohol dehydrogenase family)
VGVALVTGCSTGIGFATALRLARAGHEVFASMRRPEGASELRAIAASQSTPMEVLRLDVECDASVQAAVDHVMASKGRIDLLVNNAGLGASGTVEETAMSTFREVMETNYFGALRCLKAVVPAMRAQRSGLIVNVSSVSGRVVMAANAAYSASKFALESMSESLAQELKAFNVRLAIVEPGVIVTPIFSKTERSADAGLYPASRRLGALYRALLENGSTPALVADQILQIVDGTSWQLRYLVGPDAFRTVAWRAQLSDEQWIDLAASDDTLWVRQAQAELGLTLAL